MAEENIYNNYSFTDIQRYLSGSMTPAEMHAIEKAALEDPFLADAIEGYRSTDAETALQHLNQIEAALYGEHADAKIISINKNKRNRWRLLLSIAATALFAIAGIYLFSKTNGNNKNTLAQVEKKETNPPVENNKQVLKSDTATTITPPAFLAYTSEKNQPAIKNSGRAKKTSETETKITSSSEAAGTLSGYNQNAQQKEIYADATVIANTASTKNANATNADKQNASGNDDTFLPKTGIPANDKKYAPASGYSVTLNGRVFDNTGKAVPNAIVNINGTNTSAVTDAKGKFSINAPDSILQATVSAVGFDAKPVTLAKDDKNILFIRQNKTFVDVATTSVGKKKDTEGVQVLAEKKNATPVGGWDVYEGYVQGRLTTLQDTVNNEVHIYGDEVELEFAIDENGNPYDFSVITPSDPDLDKKAIDVVSEGPRWIRRSKNKKAHLKIKF